MKRTSPTLTMVSRTLLALGATALLGAPALAAGLGETCEATTDCDTGLACEVVGGTGCACAEPSPGTPSDSDGDAFAPSPCDCPEPEEFKACVPGPCSSNADCGAGLVCASWEEPCAGTRPAVPCSSEEPDCGDPMPSEEECTPTTYSVCAPSWILPCEAAADCGAGFTCETVEECTCYGSGGTPVDPTEPSEGGGSDDSSGDGSDSSGDREGAPYYYEEPNCDCAPSEDKWCRPVEVSCTSNDDCVAGWVCQSTSNDVPCTMPEPSGDGFAPNDCDAPRPETESTGLCQPLGWGGWYGDSRDEAGENTSTPTTPTNPSEPNTNPTPGPSEDDGTSQAPGTKAAGGGCAGGGMPVAMALIGLVFVARRRFAKVI